MRLSWLFQYKSSPWWLVGWLVGRSDDDDGVEDGEETVAWFWYVAGLWDGGGMVGVNDLGFYYLLGM